MDRVDALAELIHQWMHRSVVPGLLEVGGVGRGRAGGLAVNTRNSPRLQVNGLRHMVNIE